MNESLLRQVQHFVLENPELVNMHWFLTDKSPCGCIGEHLGRLSGPAREWYSLKEAAQDLDLDSEEAFALFFFHDNSHTPFRSREFIAWKSYWSLRREITKLTPGTPAYAAVVARAIEHAIERNQSSPKGAASPSHLGSEAAPTFSEVLA